MTPPTEPEPAPVRLDETGVLRVGNTRILLELVVSAYTRGETPEAIVESYDVLQLAEVYAVIAYYLRHRDAVDEYLRERDQRAVEIRAKIEARRGNMTELRARLQAKRDELRKNQSEFGHPDE